jgi:hypothetical protein
MSVMSSFNPETAHTRNAEHAQVLACRLREFVARLPDPSTAEWSEVIRSLAQHPERAQEIQERYYKLHMELWLHLLGEGPAPAQPVGTEPGDHRFDDPDWDALPWFRYLKQTYSSMHAGCGSCSSWPG